MVTYIQKKVLGGEAFTNLGRQFEVLKKVPRPYTVFLPMVFTKKRLGREKNYAKIEISVLP